mmetsp:Transcript_22250/g.69242  ORF Transcript_22250/g.69242 Transcript_22250/m.69242 type:complete len:148 (-) Transcript_22250:52-495(-)
MDRTEALMAIAGKLKALASRYNLAVVVTNHVVDVMDAEPGDPQRAPPTQVGHLGVMMTSRRRVVPSLGLAWSSCVNTRLFVSRARPAAEEGEAERSIEVVFAPHLPPGRCGFVVSSEGVRGLAAAGEGGPAPTCEGAGADAQGRAWP